MMLPNDPDDFEALCTGAWEYPEQRAGADGDHVVHFSRLDGEEPGGDTCEACPMTLSTNKRSGAVECTSCGDGFYNFYPALPVTSLITSDGRAACRWCIKCVTQPRSRDFRVLFPARRSPRALRVETRLSSAS